MRQILPRLITAASCLHLTPLYSLLSLPLSLPHLPSTHSSIPPSIHPLSLHLPTYLPPSCSTCNLSSFPPLTLPLSLTPFPHSLPSLYPSFYSCSIPALFLALSLPLSLILSPYPSLFPFLKPFHYPSFFPSLFPSLYSSFFPSQSFPLSLRLSLPISFPPSLPLPFSHYPPYHSLHPFSLPPHIHLCPSLFLCLYFGCTFFVFLS